MPGGIACSHNGVEDLPAKHLQKAHPAPQVNGLKSLEKRKTTI